MYIQKNGDFNVAGEESVILKAVVTKVLDKRVEQSNLGGANDYITFNAMITEGSMDGAEVTATQLNDIHMAVKMKEVEVGDKIILSYIGEVETDGEWMLAEYIRTDKLIMLGIIFVVLLLIFGRFNGVSTILSLCFTCLSIFVVLVPAIIGGFNVYFWTIIVSVFIIVMTIILVNGISTKSIVAAIGCFGGVSICGLITIVMKHFLYLTGMVDEESMFLLMLHSENPIDLNAIIFAAIIIGAVGAIMDVAISMSSSLYEVAQQTENPQMKTILKSGINIGRDILGTMSNTLILAYIGSSLTVVLLLVAYNQSLTALFNREMIIVEILQALTGSFGLLLTIPLTSVVASIFFTKKCEISK
ncbi:MAG: YibE/F family protein [Oscillospiraceae bacterium]